MRTFSRLTDIDATFRSVTSKVGLQPVWHRKSGRTRAHLGVTVLVCHADHLLGRQLVACCLHDS